MKAAMAAVLGEGNGRFVPGLIAVLVYLAVISLAAMLLVGGVATRWQEDLTGRLSIQLPIDQLLPEAEATPARDAKLEAALALLRAQPEIARAERVSEGRIALLLQPWIGSAEMAHTLPLPAVIDVELRPDARARTVGVRERLRVALPDATIDGGPAMLAPALRLMRGFEALAMLLVVVLAATLAAAVVYATRARLATQRETVEILHLLGAEEPRIVDALARGALRTAMIGGLIGFAAGMATLLAIGRLAAADGDVQGDLSLPAAAWAAVAALPLAAAAIAALTARVTARRTLQEMP